MKIKIEWLTDRGNMAESYYDRWNDAQRAMATLIRQGRECIQLRVVEK